MPNEVCQPDRKDDHLRKKTLAHVVPLAVFLAFNLFPAWVRIDNSAIAWYWRAPEHWLYPLQTLVCGALLLIFRRHYELKPWRQLPLALALGALGFCLWIAPAVIHRYLIANNHTLPPMLEWLGLTSRENGFDPDVLSFSPLAEVSAVGMRFIRMVVVVPFVEELFWRGFLMRYLVSDSRVWTSIPFGTHRWKVFWMVTLLVMLAHQPADYAGAFIWAALVYGLAVRTRSLGACVLMHATCNLLLGLYVMATKQWGFW